MAAHRRDKSRSDTVHARLLLPSVLVVHQTNQNQQTQNRSRTLTKKAHCRSRTYQKWIQKGRTLRWSVSEQINNPLPVITTHLLFSLGCYKLFGLRVRMIRTREELEKKKSSLYKTGEMGVDPSVVNKIVFVSGTFITGFLK